MDRAWTIAGLIEPAIVPVDYNKYTQNLDSIASTAIV